MGVFEPVSRTVTVRHAMDKRLECSLGGIPTRPWNEWPKHGRRWARRKRLISARAQRIQLKAARKRAKARKVVSLGFE